MLQPSDALSSSYLGAHFKEDKTKRISVTDVLLNTHNDALIQQDGYTQ